MTQTLCQKFYDIMSEQDPKWMPAQEWDGLEDIAKRFDTAVLSVLSRHFDGREITDAHHQRVAFRRQPNWQREAIDTYLVFLTPLSGWDVPIGRIGFNTINGDVCVSD